MGLSLVSMETTVWMVWDLGWFLLFTEEGSQVSQDPAGGVRGGGLDPAVTV
jgi:hypothetical protein